MGNSHNPRPAYIRRILATTAVETRPVSLVRKPGTLTTGTFEAPPGYIDRARIVVENWQEIENTV